MIQQNRTLYTTILKQCINLYIYIYIYIYITVFPPDLEEQQFHTHAQVCDIIFSMNEYTRVIYDVGKIELPAPPRSSHSLNSSGSFCEPIYITPNRKQSGEFVSYTIRYSFKGGSRGEGLWGLKSPPFIFRLYLINMLSIIMKFCLSIII